MDVVRTVRVAGEAGAEREAQAITSAVNALADSGRRLTPEDIGPRLTCLMDVQRDRAITYVGSHDDAIARAARLRLVGVMAKFAPDAMVRPAGASARPLSVMHAQAAYVATAAEGGDVGAAAQHVLTMCKGMEAAYLGSELSAFYREKAATVAG